MLFSTDSTQNTKHIMITKLPSATSPYALQAKVIQPGNKPLLAISQLEPGKILMATVGESRGQNMFILDTTDLQLTVESKLPLVKGEQVQLQVLRTSPALELMKVESGSAPPRNLQPLALMGEVIDVKPLLQSLQNSYFAPQVTETSQQTTQPAFQKMETGAIEQLIRQGNYTIKPSVIENLGEKSLLRIGSETFTLSGQLPAKPGESQILQLQSLQPTPTFFPVSNDGVVNKSQPLLLSQPPQALPALVRALQLPLLTGLDLLLPVQQKLLHNLQSLQPAQLQEPNAGELLKTNMEQLGLRSEALVAHGKEQEAATQLKSVLAEIGKLFQGQEKINSATSHLLATIENSQFVQTNLQQENNLLFPLPFSFLEKGYLLVDQEGEQQNGREEPTKDFTCTLHLAMEGLGNIRVRCVQSEESMRIAFYLDSQEKADFISTFQGELTESISSAPLLSLSFTSGAEPPGSALLQMILPAQQSMLDTSA